MNWFVIHLLCFINITAQSGNDVITFVLEKKGKYPIKHNLYDERSNYEVHLINLHSFYMSCKISITYLLTYTYKLKTDYH